MLKLHDYHMCKNLIFITLKNFFKRDLFFHVSFICMRVFDD